MTLRIPVLPAALPGAVPEIPEDIHVAAMHSCPDDPPRMPVEALSGSCPPAAPEGWVVDVFDLNTALTNGSAERVEKLLEDGRKLPSIHEVLCVEYKTQLMKCTPLCAAIQGPATQAWQTQRQNRSLRDDISLPSISSRPRLTRPEQFWTPSDFKIVQLLVDSKASVENDYLLEERGWERDPNKKFHRVRPIHLAAGTGNIKVLDFLLERKACIDGQSEFGGGQTHVSVLHEAVFFEQTEMVSHLLGCKVNCDLLNFGHDTALHLACSQGFDPVLPNFGRRQTHLLEALRDRTDIRKENKKGKDCIDVAIDSGRLHMDALPHLLKEDQANFEDWKGVAKRIAPRAVQLCSRQSSGSKKWREVIREAAKENSLEDMLTDSLRESSVLGRVLLDTCTTTAEYEHTNDRRFNPMPIRQALPAQYPHMRVCIANDDRWGCNARNDFNTNGRAPAWQNVFKQNMACGEEIDMKVCLIRDVVQVPVMSGIAKTRDEKVPELPVVKAMLQLVWSDHIFHVYTAHVCYDVVVLAALVLWSTEVVQFDRPGEALPQILCWNAVCTVSVKHLVYECFEFWQLGRRYLTDSSK